MDAWYIFEFKKLITPHLESFLTHLASLFIWESIAGYLQKYSWY